jgi:chemotaxis signal transduction protein
MAMISTKSKKLRRLLPHMLHVTENRETLKSLESVWDVLNLLGQLSGTTTEMGDTKAAFATLTGNLLENLALTTFNKRVQQIAAPAQVAIDILVRNLFERTADIGFLATDDALRSYAAACRRGETPDRAAMSERLLAYVRRYSVYRDVILVAPDGAVLARLPGAPQVERIGDPLLAEVLASDAPYTEAAVCSELFPGESRNLFYAVRVQDEAGNVLGALFLCFDFENEIGRVFKGLARTDDWSVIALMDDAGKIIASSDPYQVMSGAVVDAPYGDGHLLRFAGGSYLASRRAAQGFQAYMGPPGWSALVMVPLDMAFDQDDKEDAQDRHDEALIRAVLHSGAAFPPELQAIPLQADAIQRELNRSVWNANIRQGVASMNPAFSKVLLAEIVRTGTRMKEVFTRSIRELQTMVVASQLDDCQFLAALAMDILDRNLYERANDCRWWALDPLLRSLLEDEAAEQRSERLSARLAAINDLYTVYDSLLLFDAHGVVVAASRPQAADWIGRTLDAAWCTRALALPDAESYTVSGFEASGLYGGQPAYVYAAALHGGSGRGVGGIAIVFDSGPQIAAMLGAALPSAPGSFALFIDADNNVIASTDPQRPAGSRVNVPADVRAQAMDGGVARLVVLDGQVMAIGAQASAGYREYPGTEGLPGQRVLALVCVPLGEAGSEQAAEDWMPTAAPSTAPVAAGQGETVDIASFHVGRYLLGVPASAVLEAIPFGGFVRLPNTSPNVRGAMVYRGGTMLIYDLHKALGLTPRTRPEDMLTVVLSCADGRKFGILVDRLADIPAVPRGDIAPVSDVFVGITPVLASVVKSSGEHGPMLTLLAVEHMAEVLNTPGVGCDIDPAALLE